MRIAIGGMQHETNTFTTLTTPLSGFLQAEGEAMLDIPPGVQGTSLQGIIEVCREQGIEVVPTFFARTLPSGIIEREAYDVMKRRLLDGLAGGDGIDAVVLALHGSMYVDGIGDADGDLLASIRAAAPRGIPIVCALDLHGTITDQMIQNADAFVGYRTAPHVDEVETGRRACELAIWAVRESIELTTEWVSIPMLISGEHSETRVPPTSEIIAQLVHMPGSGGIISSSIFFGFPWADVPYSCVSTLAVTAKEDAALGLEEARRLAQQIWDRRYKFVFTTEAHDLGTCLDIAEAEDSRPIIISDSGDNPTAGSSQDLTNVLAELLERSVKNALVAAVFDKDSYERCVEAGPGSCVDLKLGRVNPGEDNPKALPVRAYVERLGFGKGVPAAVIKIDDIRVIVTERRTEVYDPSFLTGLGLNPMDFKVIIAKSGYLSPELRAMTKRPMLALTPGDTNLLFETVPYRQVRRPIFPLDKDFDWSAGL
jgi:microcystin degradation protein MlrC